jgi:hypothetical protein
MCVVCVLCLVVVPLPPGENPFAVKINNDNNKNQAAPSHVLGRRNFEKLFYNPE